MPLSHNQKRIEIEEMPITLLLTDYCNRNCVHCSEDATIYRNRAHYLDLPALQEGLKDLYGGWELHITGGEPTLHPDFRLEDGSYLRFFEQVVDRFEKPIICTNGWWTRTYKGEADYKTNPSFRESVDRTKERIKPLVTSYQREDGSRKVVKLSLTANPWLAHTDISPKKMEQILREAELSGDELMEMLKEDDLYKRVGNSQDPMVRVMKESRLYKRVQVLKETDRRLREEHGIDPEENLAILYFIVPAAGLTSEITKANQDATMQIFDIPEHLTGRSPLYAYGKAEGWKFAREPPLEQEPTLMIAPGPPGRFRVYGTKYQLRTPVTEEALGIVNQPGDLMRIIKENEWLTYAPHRKQFV